MSWEHLQNVGLILLPLFIGFAIKLPKGSLKILDKILLILVYVILWLIGAALAQVEQLWQELGKMVGYAILLFVLLLCSNLAILIWYDKRFFRQHPFTPHQNGACQRIQWQDSLKQLLTLIAGIIWGMTLPEWLQPAHQSGQYTLMTLILIVGLQMRSQGMALKTMLLNPHGLTLSLWFMISCAVAGLVFAALLPEVSWTKGLALSSGYGWYSLSGMLMTQTYGATWGAVALLNDLLREFAALTLIPILMQRFPSTAIGVGGATSLDFTLPIIQQSGGLAAVPVAIAFGLIVNVAAPFLMVGFAALS